MKDFVRTIQDYPIKGIQFRDITTLLQKADLFHDLIDEMTKPWENEKIDAIVSIEARGFIMAGAIAYKLSTAFIPMRKPDKLPAETFKVKFDLLSDEETKVVKKYKVWGKKKFMGREYMGINRSTFLINPKGKIVKIWENVNVKDHALEVLETLKSISK